MKQISLKKMTQNDDPDDALRNDIHEYLEQQGFVVGAKTISLLEHSRTVYRNVQELACTDKIKQRQQWLMKNLKLAQHYCRNGCEIDPVNIQLELRTVRSGSLEEKLFRWWNLIWWSIPYERAYGRQMRYILWDVTHDSPFGLIGLQSAQLKMKSRDDFLGIPREKQDWWVNMSLSAQRVGALPPYNQLLGGKMVALTLGSSELRDEYRKKYLQTQSLITKRSLPSQLLFLTTTGAFGKSSIYNRLKVNSNALALHIGYTQGSGTFHISDKLYGQMLDYLQRQEVDVSRGYGHGPSRKRQLISKACNMLDLPDYQYHGIKRAVYLFPHALNLKEVITSGNEPIWSDIPFQDLFNFWKKRWMIPRVERDQSWNDFLSVEYFKSVKILLESLGDGE